MPSTRGAAVELTCLTLGSQSLEVLFSLKECSGNSSRVTSSTVVDKESPRGGKDDVSLLYNEN